MAIGNQVYNVKQAAEVIGCSEIWVRKLAKQGILEGEQLGDNPNAPWMLDRKSVNAYARKQMTTGRPRGPRNAKKRGKKSAGK